ncbi:metal-dependent hydrolase [Patescibacteria group bacterium]
MPDLITHVAFASFFADKKYRYIFFLLLGAVLPDVTRLFFLIFPDNYQAYWFFTAMHSPLVMILMALLVVQFFAEKLRWAAFWWLLLGILTHLVLDSLQLHFGSYAYPWFFPFSFQGTEWGLFWPEDPLYVAPFLVILAILWYYWRSKKLKMKASQTYEK